MLQPKDFIGVGSGGATRPPPPSFKLGGHRPPNFTHCLHNELHCSIVDRIACRHCSSRKSHFCCLKKMSPPQVRTSSYAYGFAASWRSFSLIGGSFGASSSDSITSDTVVSFSVSSSRFIFLDFLTHSYSMPFSIKLTTNYSDSPIAILYLQ